MKRDKNIFIALKEVKGGSFILGNNNSGRIIRKGTIKYDVRRKKT